MKKILLDLENIFEQAMASGQLAIALKAKELIGKFVALKPTIKPLSQWSEEEIKSFLSLIDQEPS